jgi:hypothetical protein
VRYYLGMTQARLTREMLIGLPHLVHLAVLGQTTNELRPDFIAFDLSSMTYTVAVVAKGRDVVRRLHSFAPPKCQRQTAETPNKHKGSERVSLVSG